jgi:hypothetical protein
MEAFQIEAHRRKEVMLLNTKRAFKDRCRSIFVVKMAGTNPNGRYGILTTGTVPAVSIMNGA